MYLRKGFNWQSCRLINHKVANATSARSKYGSTVRCCSAQRNLTLGWGVANWGADWGIGVKVCSRPSASLVWRCCAEGGRHSKALTALTAPLEKECDRSGEKQELHVCGHTPHPTRAWSKFLYILPWQWLICMMLSTALKHMESNIFFWLAHPCLTGRTALLPRKPDWLLMFWGARA